MKRFLKILSNCTLILVPFCPIGAIYAAYTGNIIWILFLLGLIFLIIDFHSSAFQDEHDDYQKRFDELSKDYNYLGVDYFDGCEIWQHKKTNDIITQ